MVSVEEPVLLLAAPRPPPLRERDACGPQTASGSIPTPQPANQVPSGRYTAEAMRAGGRALPRIRVTEVQIGGETGKSFLDGTLF
jgi:hypothetical protein